MRAHPASWAGPVKKYFGFIDFKEGNDDKRIEKRKYGR